MAHEHSRTGSAIRPAAEGVAEEVVVGMAAMSPWREHGDQSVGGLIPVGCGPCKGWGGEGPAAPLPGAWAHVLGDKAGASEQELVCLRGAAVCRGPVAPRADVLAAGGGSGAAGAVPPVEAVGRRGGRRGTLLSCGEHGASVVGRSGETGPGEGGRAVERGGDVGAGWGRWDVGAVEAGGGTGGVAAGGQCDGDDLAASGGAGGEDGWAVGAPLRAGSGSWVGPGEAPWGDQRWG
ncbi:MAG: hypothetical protein QXP27_03930, partial [Candidatus Methanomethyliaceae archaeon]